MDKLLACELEYFPNPHLMQIYAGFFELQKLGIIDLSIKKNQINCHFYSFDQRVDQ